METPVLEHLIDKQFSYAVIGASQNRDKYGNKVYRNLLDAGYTVYPINPNADEVEGQEAFVDVSACIAAGNKVDVAVFVVPPHVSEDVLKQVLAAGITKVWMQPGSQSEAAIKFAQENGIEIVAGPCIMVHRARLGR
jgi:hypothetical protein